ncbi:hypothetical protein HDU86_003984 [Geranomyces michiganensis]|nr:hypothetical protein HDU86_003984 [Geranomyces michiganensis]
MTLRIVIRPPRKALLPQAAAAAAAATDFRRAHSTLHPAIPAAPIWTLTPPSPPPPSTQTAPPPPPPPPTITASTITHLARLAGLSLTDTDTTDTGAGATSTSTHTRTHTYVKDINALCALVDPIRAVDTRGVQPLVSLLRDVNAGVGCGRRERDDDVLHVEGGEGGEAEEVRSRALLKCAQRVDGPYYVVETQP